MSKQISIIGLGWLGLPLALSLKQAGYTVNGTYSNPSRKEECDLLPFSCERICFSDHKIEGNWNILIENSDILMINIPPKRNSNGDILYFEYIQHIIKHTPANKSIIFISSTSVYGNIDSKITENSIPQPATLSGQALLQSEQALKNHFKDQITILRCSGLIGPNRHPGRFLAGRTNVANPNGLINIVHQQDCIQIITKLIEQHKFGYTLNICSNEHPTREAFYTKATQLLKQTPPEFMSDDTFPLKYIDNTLSKTILNHTYLTVNEALKKC